MVTISGAIHCDSDDVQQKICFSLQKKKKKESLKSIGVKALSLYPADLVKSQCHILALTVSPITENRSRIALKHYKVWFTAVGVEE